MSTGLLKDGMGMLTAGGGVGLLGNSGDDCCCESCTDTCNARCEVDHTPRVIDIDIFDLVLCNDCVFTSMFGGGGLKIATTSPFTGGTFRCQKVDGQQCQWVYNGDEIILTYWRYLDGECIELLETFDDDFVITVNRESTTLYTVCITVAGVMLGYYLITTDEKDCMTDWYDIANESDVACDYRTSSSNEFGSCISSGINVMGNGGTIDFVPLC